MDRQIIVDAREVGWSFGMVCQGGARCECPLSVHKGGNAVGWKEYKFKGYNRVGMIDILNGRGKVSESNSRGIYHTSVRFGHEVSFNFEKLDNGNMDDTAAGVYISIGVRSDGGVPYEARPFPVF